MVRERKTLSFSNNKPAQLQSQGYSRNTYKSFSEIPAGQNPANFVLINGRYFFNDYDTTGNYLRSLFSK